MGLIQQADFGGGIFRAPRAPQGSVYDCVNGLVDNESVIYRRGGSAYQSSAFPLPVRGIADGQIAAGNRTAVWTLDTLYMLNPADDSTPVAVPGIAAGDVPRAHARVFGMGGMLAVKTVNNKGALLIGGSTKATYNTGTLSVAAGDTAVTGVGTAWLANADAGMIIQGPTGFTFGVVAKVISNTSLTLQDPAVSALAAGSVYTLRPVELKTMPATSEVGTSHVATVGSPPRLVITVGSRAYFSHPGQWWFMDATDYHEVPAPAEIIGCDAVRDMLVLFTTTGVWVVRNMNLDLTDADGNTQQQLEQITKDVILLDDNGVAGLSTYAGIVGWGGQFIVPTVDDVYIMGVDAPPVGIGRGIQPLYRSYVAAGYKLGTATLYRGCYFMPIITAGPTLVDVLVCRLDQRDSRGALRPAWTRLSGHASSRVYTGRRRDVEPPRLLGQNFDRVTDLRGIFSPSAANKNDADGTTHNLDVTFNDVEVPRSTLQRVRVTAEIVDAATDNPTVAASYGVDLEEGAALTALADVMSETTTTPKSWRIVKRGRRFRLRLLSSGPAARLRIRVVEWFVRDSNRP